MGSRVRVVHVTGSQMDAAPYLGHEGIRRYLAEKAELWSELRFDTEEALEGKDYDIVVGFLRGTGRGSGARVEQRIGLVYELRGRKIRYCRARSSWPNATMSWRMR